MTKEKGENDGLGRGVSIDDITYTRSEDGTLNAYMCIQGRERAKKLATMCLLTKWMNSISSSERHTRIANIEDIQNCLHLCS